MRGEEGAEASWWTVRLLAQVAEGSQVIDWGNEDYDMWQRVQSQELDDQKANQK
jgi:hypothetical protein